jgi:hypothetical protein
MIMDQQDTESPLSIADILAPMTPEEIRAGVRARIKADQKHIYTEVGEDCWLPLRADVGDYILDVLCAPGTGPLGCHHNQPPLVYRCPDGTIALCWNVTHRRLVLQVKCKDVLIAIRSSAKEAVVIREILRDLHPPTLSSRLEALFAWLSPKPPPKPERALYRWLRETEAKRK